MILEPFGEVIGILWNGDVTDLAEVVELSVIISIPRHVAIMARDRTGQWSQVKTLPQGKSQSNDQEYKKQDCIGSDSEHRRFNSP